MKIYILGGMSLLFSFLLIPFFKRVYKNIGILDMPGGRKSHELPTPTCGGIVFLLSVWLLLFVLNPIYPKLVFLGALIAFLIGFVDDTNKDRIPWQIKLFGHILCSAVASYGLFPGNIHLQILFIVYSTLMINAINLEDNMNGISIGVSIVILLILILKKDIHTRSGILSFLGILALIPLFLFNFPKGRIFLGDQGSILIGYTIAVLLFQNGAKNIYPDPAIVTIGIFPILDMFITFLYRITHGLSPTKADQNHLSHRLSRTGLGNFNAAVVIWILTFVLGYGCSYIIESLKQ